MSISYRQTMRLSLLIAMLFIPVCAGAECITPRADWVNETSIEAIFSGTVVGLNEVGELGTRITFNVDRVWKGQVPKRFDLHVWELDSERPKFEFHRAYIVFAHRMSQKARQGAGLIERDPVALTTTSCGAVPLPSRAFPDPNATSLLGELGAGEAPR